MFNSVIEALKYAVSTQAAVMVTKDGKYNVCLSWDEFRNCAEPNGWELHMDAIEMAAMAHKEGLLK